RGSKVRDERGQAVSTPGDKGVKVVVGGGTIVMPLLNRVGRLKLTARQINVQLSDAVTSQGIKVQVQGVATFKIGRDVESLRNAAERFLDAKPEQVDSIVKHVPQGSRRPIVGTLPLEQLIRARTRPDPWPRPRPSRRSCASRPSWPSWRQIARRRSSCPPPSSRRPPTHRRSSHAPKAPSAPASRRPRRTRRRRGWKVGRKPR